MIEITQQELDEAQRKQYLVNREEVINIIKSHFEIVHANMVKRSAYDQTILGNLVTCLESEIKKDIKKLSIK